MPCPPLPVVHLTAKLGGVGRLLQLLDSRPDMVDADDHEVTRQSPLHYACEAGRVGAVRLLLDRAACIDRRDAMGYTPLMVACKYGWAEVVSLLLARGADTGLRNCCYLQETVLMHACCCTSPPTSPGSDHVAVVRLLLKHGAAAAINERDRLGQTALLKACLVGSMGVARVLLVEGGADPWLPDRRGSTPMHAALTEGRTKCVELLQVRGWVQAGSLVGGKTHSASSSFCTAGGGGGVCLSVVVRGGAGVAAVPATEGAGRG